MHTNLCSLVQPYFMHFTTSMVLLLLLCCSRIHFMGLLTRKKIEPTNTATTASHRVNMENIFIPMDFAPTANEQMREIWNADFTSLSDDFLWTWICCFFLFIYSPRLFAIYRDFWIAAFSLQQRARMLQGWMFEWCRRKEKKLQFISVCQTLPVSHGNSLNKTNWLVVV